MAWRLRASRESRTPDRRSCLSVGSREGMGFMLTVVWLRWTTGGTTLWLGWWLMHPIGAVAAEAPGAEVGCFQRGELGQLGLQVEAIGENLLDAAVGRGAEVQRPGAGGLESFAAQALAQAQQPLRGAQGIEDAVAEQTFDHRAASRPDQGGCLQADLLAAHQQGHCTRGQVFVDGGSGAGLEQPGMHGDELVVAVDAHRTGSDFQPQLLPDQRERGRVGAILK